MKVREKLPKRRKKPTNFPKEGNWTQHKADLRKDFHEHCGYCGSYDGYRHTWYEVDHFIPKNLFLQHSSISTVDYTNLVYSCKFCNNNKGKKWHSKHASVPNITVSHLNNEGFVDPCDSDYDTHFFRTNTGGIMWKTPLGKWMWHYAFKFDERDYCIKLLWQLNQLRKLIDSLIIELEKIDKNIPKYSQVKQQLGEFALVYYKYHKKLTEYYNSI